MGKAVWELIKSGGWLMIPIIACSVIAMAVVLNRLWALRSRKVLPKGLVASIWQLHRTRKLDDEHVDAVRLSSPLGRVLAAGLVNRRHPREIMKESIEEEGRRVVLELERYLNTLGSIASISPLLGLLGTVFGMIQVFNAIVGGGMGRADVLAGGIAQALITTAAGLGIAILSVFPFNYFNARVESAAHQIEQYATSLEIVYEKLQDQGAGEKS
jgi:biopolymer transport protein ExbB